MDNSVSVLSLPVVVASIQACIAFPVIGATNIIVTPLGATCGAIRRAEEIWQTDETSSENENHRFWDLLYQYP